MPTHIFISMCNILSTQFKEEAKKQEEAEKGNNNNMQSFSIPDFNSIASNISSSLPRM